MNSRHLSPTLTPFGAGEKPFVYVTMTADSVGKLTLAANQSDASPPLSDILLFGEDTAVDVSVVDFGFPLNVTIVQMVNAEDDAFPVAPNVILEDGGAVNLDVLQNDFRFGTTVKPTLDPAGLTQPANGFVAMVGSLRSATLPTPTSSAPTRSSTGPSTVWATRTPPP